MPKEIRIVARLAAQRPGPQDPSLQWNRATSRAAPNRAYLYSLCDGVYALTDIPAKTDYNIRNGRTYMYFQHAALSVRIWAEGITTFSYANLTLSSPTLASGGQVTVSVDVTNTGAVAGDEVVQLYVSCPTTAGVPRPIKQLRGFQRITLAPGSKQTVSMPLDERPTRLLGHDFECIQGPARHGARDGWGRLMCVHRRI